MLPQGVAFATIAGMPPEYGLYAAIVPTIVAALFGSSWHLVAGPSTTASLVLFSALSAFAEPGSAHYVKLAMTLAFMVGLLELTLGIFRLGAIVNFISHSVIIGFTAGVGVLIIITQTRNFAGLSIPSGTPIYEMVWDILTRLERHRYPHDRSLESPRWRQELRSGAIFRASRSWLWRSSRAACLAFCSTLFGAHVKTVGALPTHFPHLSSPSFDPETWVLLLPAALALGISALNKLVSISRAIAIRSGQHVDANQEFIGQGLANSIGSFFSGYVVSSSFNRSALNYAVGAQTPLSAIFAGVFADWRHLGGGAAGRLPALFGDGRLALLDRLGTDRPPEYSADRKNQPDRSVHSRRDLPRELVHPCAIRHSRRRRSFPDRLPLSGIESANPYSRSGSPRTSAGSSPTPGQICLNAGRCASFASTDLCSSGP